VGKRWRVSLKGEEKKNDQGEDDSFVPFDRKHGSGGERQHSQGKPKGGGGERRGGRKNTKRVGVTSWPQIMGNYFGTGESSRAGKKIYETERSEGEGVKRG